MLEKRKVWAGVGSALATSLTMSQATAVPMPVAQPNTALYAPGPMQEGEATVSVDLATHDPQFLAQLGLIRGHLWVGMKLYDEGHKAMAKTHMKHPGDELYAGLVNAFNERGLPGFGEELTALADAVNNDQPEEQVHAAYQALKEAISANEPIAQMSAKEVLLSISSMLITSADEYAVGIQDKQVAMVHEYQDAYGFQQIALARLDAISPSEAEKAKAEIAKTRQLINDLAPLWPTTTPEGTVEGDASAIYGTASRIELEANDI